MRKYKAATANTKERGLITDEGWSFAISTEWRNSSDHFRSEEHTSELQSQSNLVCRLLLEKKKNYSPGHTTFDILHDRLLTGSCTYSYFSPLRHNAYGYVIIHDLRPYLDCYRCVLFSHSS